MLHMDILQPAMWLHGHGSYSVCFNKDKGKCTKVEKMFAVQEKLQEWAYEQGKRRQIFI